MAGRLSIFMLFFLSFGQLEANPFCALQLSLMQKSATRTENWQKRYAEAEKADDVKAGQFALSELMRMRPDLLGLKGWLSNFWSRRYVRQLALAHKEKAASSSKAGALEASGRKGLIARMLLKDFVWSQAPFILRVTGFVTLGADRVRDRLISLSPDQIKELTGSSNQSYFLNVVSGWFGPEKTPSKFIRRLALERMLRTLALSVILGMSGASPLLFAEHAIQEPQSNFLSLLHNKAQVDVTQKNIVIVNLDSEMKPYAVSKRFETLTKEAASAEVIDVRNLEELDQLIGKKGSADIIVLNIRSAPGIFQMSETFVAPWTEIPEFRNHMKPGATLIFAGNQFADIPIEMRDDEPWVKISKQMLDPKSGRAVGFINDLQFGPQGFPGYMKSTLMLPVETSYGGRHLNLAGPLLWNQIPQVFDGQRGVRIYSQETKETEFKSSSH